MSDFLNSNEWQWRLARTVTQGAAGVIVADIGPLVGTAVLGPTWRALVVALVMGGPYDQPITPRRAVGNPRKALGI